MPVKRGPSTVEEFEDGFGEEVAGRDFSGKVFRNKDFTDCFFRNCNFSGASFPGTKLDMVVFTGCKFANADFSKASLSGVCFVPELHSDYADLLQGVRFPEPLVRFGDVCELDFGNKELRRGIFLCEDKETISLLMSNGKVEKYPFWVKYTDLRLVK